VRKAFASALVFVFVVRIVNIAKATQFHVIAPEEACFTRVPVIVGVGDPPYYVKEPRSRIDCGDGVVTHRAVVYMDVRHCLTALEFIRLYDELKREGWQPKYCSRGVKNWHQHNAAGYICVGRACIDGLKFDFDGPPGLHQGNSEPSSPENGSVGRNVSLVSNGSLFVDKGSLLGGNPGLMAHYAGLAPIGPELKMSNTQEGKREQRGEWGRQTLKDHPYISAVVILGWILGIGGIGAYATLGGAYVSGRRGHRQSAVGMVAVAAGFLVRLALACLVSG